MKHNTEKLDKKLTDLMKFYNKKQKESAGGLFFIPVVRGRRLAAVWGRSRAELSSWFRHERFVVDQLIPLV